MRQAANNAPSEGCDLPASAFPIHRAQPVWVHLVAFALSIILPLWALIGFVAWTTVQQARDDQQQQMMVVARTFALELDRELAGFGGVLGTLATSPALQDGDLRRFHDQAAQVAPAGSAIVMRDRSGQQVINTLFPFGTPLPVTAAKAVRAADECVFQTRTGCVSDLYTGTTDHQPYILFDAPVIRDGKVQFALNIAVRAQHLASLLAKHQLPAGWVASITDRQYQIVARLPEHDRFVGKLAVGVQKLDVGSDEDSVRSLNAAGVPVWGAYVRLPSWGWRVAIGVPEEILGAPLRRSALYLSGAGMLAIGLSVAAALIYGRRLAVSIQALTRMASDVGAMRAPSPLPTSIRELDQVAASLAAAGDRLQAMSMERDRAQADLWQLNDELRIRVKSEVAARQEAQGRLAQAQRMEALGQLAGGIAHDFNNVLQAVSGGLALIGRRAGDAEVVRQLALMAGDAAGRGAAITGRLLSFARKGELRAEPVAVVPLLDGMREILGATLGPGIETRIATGSLSPSLLADKAQLETVLVNLAVNARDAMPDGGCLILHAADELVAVGSSHPAGLGAGVFIRLDVTDTGTGMDPATLMRASEPFFTTKPLGQGTGLGLAMARGFAQQSNGGFAIRSMPGEGTTVSLWFPTAPVCDPGAGTNAINHSDAPIPGPARRILVVDDDTMVRAVLVGQLEDLGYAVTQAADGLEALAGLDSGTEPDLLVTDFAMPGMNGAVLIREARRRRPALPALMLTGYADQGLHSSLEREPDAGTMLLRKPVPAAALAERVAALLDSRETSLLK